MKNSVLRLAAVADFHYTKHSHGVMVELFHQASDAADVLLVCGDLTDHGLAEEAQILADDIRAHLRVPMLTVLGNHDFESGQQENVRQAMESVGVTVLDGDAAEIDGVGFAGVCGFCGGFGERMLNAWGEPAIKLFVKEAVDQALRLEQGLSRLQSEKRVVLLHYSPLRETVVGESPEIFPFLGSSRLEEPLNRYHVAAVFHGHAHNGTLEAMTASRIPVFNVSAQLLGQKGERFRIYEIKR
jgi:Icc-related predicted phosphoesterase